MSRTTQKQRLIKAYYDNYPSLLEIAVSVVGSPDAAYDVLQNLAVRILEMNERTKITHHAAYLRKCVYHAAVNYVRREHRLLLVETVWAAHSGPDPFEQEVERFETRESLERYLKKLPPKVREAWFRHYYDGVTIAEAARELQLDPAALRQQFRRVRMRIPRDLFLTVLLLFLLR